MKLDTGILRNVVLLSHGGVGKTSVTDAMLFDAKLVDRLGSVDAGNSNVDSEPEEVKRKTTIMLKVFPIPWKDCKINIIDTPGYSDFIGDVLSGIKVAESAVLLVCASSGVQVNTEILWNILEEQNKPRIIFINRLDREGANFLKVYTELREKLSSKIFPLQIPLGEQMGFSGIINILDRKAYRFTNGTYQEIDIPAEYESQVEELREHLIEAVVENDDELLQKYLEGETLTGEEIIRGMKSAVKEGKAFPLLCGSAVKNIGIHQLLDGIKELLPSPEDGKVEILNDDGSVTISNLDPSKPASAFIFKITADPFVGKLALFKVNSGILKSDVTLVNITKDVEERIGHLAFPKGKTQEPVGEIITGDIGVIAKLQSVGTSDTLCDKSYMVKYTPIEFPQPQYSVAVIPKSKGDEEKLGNALSRLQEEDPTFVSYYNAETHQTIVSGLGDLHVEVILERLKRKFGVEVETDLPKIPYRETVTTKVKVQGRYKRQTGGRGQYGDCWIEIEPLPRGGGYEFVDKIFGGAIPKNYIPSVEKGIKEAMEEGVLAGYPLVDVRVSLVDGSYHPVDSSDMAFKIAGSMALKKGAAEANPVLLEPIMYIEVTVPEEFMGDCIADLNSKRARILGMEPQGKYQIIKAHVPMAEILRYSIDLKSITQGRGRYKVEFSHYDVVPSKIAEEIIAANKKEKEEA
ncbi:MAG: elongation factor G [Dictyoglomi bacterium]|jgi:elongation factor G|nr:elongation factor G [Dictyoglomota bacterium]HHV80413.1 elongation factor G [bacterium]